MLTRRPAVRRLLTVAAVLLAPHALAASPGDTVARLCSPCHQDRLTPAETDARMSELLAPPFNLLTAQVWVSVGRDREAFLRHVVDFTFDPAVNKIKAMRRALAQFGLMPPIGLIDATVTRDEVRQVAVHLLDRYDLKAIEAELREHNRLDEHAEPAAP